MPVVQGLVAWFVASLGLVFLYGFSARKLHHPPPPPVATPTGAIAPNHSGCSLAADSRSVKDARDLVRATLLDWGIAMDGPVLATSELVTSAIQRARDEITITLHKSPEYVRVEIHDDNPEALALNDPSPVGVSHRHSMMLVQSVVTRWGSETAADGNTVWFEVAS